MSVIQGQDGKAAAAKYASVGLTQPEAEKYRSLQIRLKTKPGTFSHCGSVLARRSGRGLWWRSFALARRCAPEGLRPSTPLSPAPATLFGSSLGEAPPLQTSPGLFGRSEHLSEGGVG